MSERPLLPIITHYPLNDRNFDFNHQELTEIQLLAKLIKTVNHIIENVNSFQGSIDGKENSVDITNKRKLSPTGNFTGSLYGQPVINVLGEIDSNKDKLLYLTNQFSDGQTGFVIDGGFFSSTGVARNFNGGLFPKINPEDECCEDINGGTF